MYVPESDRAAANQALNSAVEIAVADSISQLVKERDIYKKKVADSGNREAREKEKNRKLMEELKNANLKMFRVEYN